MLGSSRLFGYWLLAISAFPFRDHAGHFSDGVLQAYKKRTRNDGVADVELVPPFNIQQRSDVFVINAVTGVDDESSFRSQLLGSSETLKFILPKIGHGVGI